MLILYSHLTWFSFLVLMLLTSSASMLILVYANISLGLTISLVSLNSFSFNLSFLFDFMSITFISVVLLISAIVMLYSYSYIAPYSNSNVFLWLTFLFIVSMLIVVCTSSLFFLMLGWDGLGLVSFFLIVYYQSQSSITSGLFTLLINRIGDCFFLVSLGVLFSGSFNTLYSFMPYQTDSLLSAFLIITFITKSAIYPFSAWLPLAIAAPTPISALVHSSTLVTAGLYLIMRFSSFFTIFPLLIALLLVLSVFTSFYAGLNSVFETDLKNLIALSTLSHLGFIGLAFFSGFISLSFFHLLTHALFKSLLFIAIGDIMTNLGHSQDIRSLSSGATQTPGSCFIMCVSLFNLLGLPGLSGFFSNDLVLESFHYSLSSFFLIFILFLNVSFTYFYTYQLFYYSFQSTNTGAYSLLHSPLSRMHAPLLIFLGLCSLFFSNVFFNLVTSGILFVPISFLFNILPFLLSASMFLILFVNSSQPSFYSPLMWFYLSKIGGLSLFSISLFSYLHYVVSFSCVRSLEQGFANYLINSYPSQAINFSSNALYMLSASGSLSSVFYLSPFFIFLLSV